MAGNSLGGRIAWGFTWRHPERVQKLILIDPAGFSLDDSLPLPFRMARIPLLTPLLKYMGSRLLVKKSLMEVYGDPSKVTPQLVDRYYELSLRPGTREAFFERFAQQSFQDNTQHLAKIQAPTLIMWGQRDAWIPVSHAERFKKAMPQAKVIIYLPRLGTYPWKRPP